MGSDNAQDAAQALQDDERQGGNSGEGSGSLLVLLQKRRIAQFRETAADPDAPGDTEPDR